MDHNCFPLCLETILVTPQPIKYLDGIYYDTVLLLYATVTGEANVVTESTGLTVGRFIQPAVARTLIEQPNSAEKGLSIFLMDFSLTYIC